MAISGSLRAGIIAADAVVIASPEYAQAAWPETLTTMSAVVISAASVCVPVLGSGLDADGIAAQAEFAAPLAGALRAVQAAVHNIVALTD